MIKKTLSVILTFAAAVCAEAEPGKPYTHRNFIDDGDEFRFAIIPDRFGADYRGKHFHADYRGGFTNAIRVVNLLRPNFVMSVGDLIPYGWLKEPQVRQQHRELEADTKKIVPPFFYVVGNHDICPSRRKPAGLEMASQISTKVWKEFRGPDTYYSFVYRDCLFVALNSIDDITLEAKHSYISPKQFEWFRKTLEKHPDVRWTFVFMHNPGAWMQRDWLDFELKHLVSRKYTVFAGDYHTYLHVRRHNRDYYVLATAGGGGGGGLAGKDMDKRAVLMGREYGEMDHIMWVVMTKDGPVVSNIELSGVVNHDFVNQRTTKSMGGAVLSGALDYPVDPETLKHLKELKAEKARILGGRK